MKIEKIDVQTSNKAHALEICMLVDKPEFLQAIAGLRKKWQIAKLENTKGLLPKHIRLLDFKGIIKSKFNDPDESVKKFQEFNKDIDELLEQFKRGKNFRQVVLCALFAGVIPNGIYQSCYFDVVTINEPEDISKPEKYQYVLVLSPRTEKQDVDNAFAEFQQHIKEKINFESRTQSNLEKNGNLLTTQEFNELKEQALLIQAEYIKYKEKTKNAPIDEVVDEYSRFSERTQPMRDKYEALRHKIPLTMDNPDDVDLINLYHVSNIYKSAVIDAGNRRDLERARKWHWIRFRDCLNGVEKKTKTYEDIAYEWNCKCPQYPTEDKEHKKACEYCHVDASNVAHTLAPYNKLLELEQ